VLKICLGFVPQGLTALIFAGPEVAWLKLSLPKPFARPLVVLTQYCNWAALRLPFLFRELRVLFSANFQATRAIRHTLDL
jgi:hypothetical protein